MGRKKEPIQLNNKRPTIEDEYKKMGGKPAPINGETLGKITGDGSNIKPIPHPQTTEADVPEMPTIQTNIKPVKSGREKIKKDVVYNVDKSQNTEVPVMGGNATTPKKEKEMNKKYILMALFLLLGFAILKK